MPMQRFPLAALHCAPRKLIMLWCVYLLLMDVIPAAEAAGATIEVQIINPQPSLSNLTNQSDLNITVLSANTVLLLDSRLKSPASGNSTDTSGSDDPNISWWLWIMIGGGFFLLIVVLVLTAVFYSDYAKHLMGYKQLPPAEPGMPTAGKVIQVELVHPCQHPAAMMMVSGSPTQGHIP